MVYYRRNLEINVSMPPQLYITRTTPAYCILPKLTFTTPLNIGTISIFSSSDMHQFHHLLGCHAIGLILYFIFLNFFSFFKFNMPSQNSAKNNSIKIILFIISIINIDIIKIYIKNVHFILIS